MTTDEMVDPENWCPGCAHPRGACACNQHTLPPKDPTNGWGKAIREWYQKEPLPSKKYLIPVDPAPEYIEASGRWKWPLKPPHDNEGRCPAVYTASREWWEYAPDSAKPHPWAEGVMLRDEVWYWVVPAPEPPASISTSVMELATLRGALDFIQSLAEEELPFSKVGSGHEVALRHIERRAREALAAPRAAHEMSKRLVKDEGLVVAVACQLAKNDGNEDPHELVWQGNPPEPQGERWHWYEGHAKAVLNLIDHYRLAEETPDHLEDVTSAGPDGSAHDRRLGSPPPSEKTSGKSLRSSVQEVHRDAMEKSVSDWVDGFERTVEKAVELRPPSTSHSSNCPCWECTRAQLRF